MDWVERACRWWASTAVLASFAALTTAACVDVNGGAVELFWKVRDAQGEGSSCGAAEIQRVRLRARPLGGTAADDRTDEWDCGDFHGSTEFDLPEGSYAVCIEPVCGAGADRVIASVPAPIVREITLGRVSQLNALLIVTGTDGLACRPPLAAEGTERGNCLDGFR